MPSSEKAEGCNSSSLPTLLILGRSDVRLKRRSDIALERVCESMSALFVLFASSVHIEDDYI